MSTKRDFVTEILARRARGEFFPYFAPRLSLLQEALPQAESNRELLRFFPIAVIATVEGFFRKAISELLDSDPDRLQGVLESKFGREQKFDLSILSAVAGRSVTVGDLVAHLLTLTRVDHIEFCMSLVLGKSFFEELRMVHDRYAVELEGKPKTPIIGNLDPILDDLAKAFEYRHIFAHELAATHGITPVEVTQILDSARVFFNAASEVVLNNLHPNYPLTQADMSAQATAKFNDADQALRERLEEFTKGLRPDQKEVLARAQQAWLRFRDAHGAFVGLEVQGGTIAPLLTAIALEDITNERIRHLKSAFGLE